MEKQRKLLKEYSIVILILTALSLIRIIVEACVQGFGFSAMNVEGVSEDLVKATVIVIFVISILMFIPDIFVGIKGIKESNNPTSARAHIVWSLILSILAILGTATAVKDIVEGFDFGKLLALLDVALDAVLFFAYYLTAKKVSACKQ